MLTYSDFKMAFSLAIIGSVAATTLEFINNARVNFEQLSNAIDIHTRNDDNSLKAGLKYNLYYLIKKAAVVLQYSFYSQAR